MASAKPIPSRDEITQAQQLGNGLATLTSHPNCAKFYTVLSILFNDAYAAQKNPDKGNLAGLARVVRFCEKIEKWAGKPLANLQAANERRDDAAIDRAKLELHQNQGMPRFDAYERDVIRRAYLSAGEIAVINSVENAYMTRRVMVGTAIASLAAGAPILSSACFSPEKKAVDPVKKPSKRGKEYQPEETRQHIATTISEETQAVQKLLVANEKEVVPEASGTDAAQSRQDRKYLVGGALGGGALLLLLLTGGMWLNPADENNKDSSDASMNKLRAQLFNISERLGRGMDVMLDEIARRSPAPAR